MSKKLTFTVTVEFEDKISNDNEVLEVAENIARGIINESNGEGIASEDSDTFLKTVSVKPMFHQEVITKKA